METRARQRQEMRRRFEERVPALTASDFVARHVRPLLGAPTFESDFTVEIVRNSGTPRMTLRYAFDDGMIVYGKVYADGSGPSRYSVLRRLWGDGFGPRSVLRVPEPLGYCDEENLLLMRSAQGTSLASLLLYQPIEQLLPGVRAAACWLAQLHASAPAGIPLEPACDRVKVFELADRLGKAVAGHPTDLAMFLDCLMKARSLAPAGCLTPVPTHGQFSPANVFVDGSDVVVIDVDRISLSDPAKDVAMFLARSADVRAKRTSDPGEAERLAAEFLDVYRRHARLPLDNLPYYTALFALNAFAKRAKDHAAGDAARRRAEALHLDRFERCFPGDARSRTVPAPQADRRPVTADSIVPIVTEYLTPHLVPRGSADQAAFDCRGTVVQNIGTGRVTFRCELAADTVVFAKRYADGLGEHSYRVQRAFWENGFGRASKFQVPEPVAFLPENNLFLMRECPGTPLASLLGNGSGKWQAGVREAARWLAAFHRSSLRIGEPEPEWDSLKTFRLATRLVKAAAARPSERVLLLELMQMLKERFAGLLEGRPVVQTHGRFHHDHVFLSPEAVNVIDLDRSRPTDPAKDVAEFVRVLRLAAFRAGVDENLTDKITDAFLGQYLALVPEAGATLPHYWLSFLVLSYLGHVRKAPDDTSARVTAFHQREIRRVSEMRL